MAAVYVNNLVVNTGSTFQQTFNLESTDNNSALDLSGYSVASQMRKWAGASTATDFTTAVVSATDGTCTIALTDVVTSALDEGRYVWDLITTDGSGLKTRRIEGRATVTPSVTR